MPPWLMQSDRVEKDELMKAAGAGVRRAGETILATSQAIADLRK